MKKNKTKMALIFAGLLAATCITGCSRSGTETELSKSEDGELVGDMTSATDSNMYDDSMPDMIPVDDIPEMDENTIPTYPADDTSHGNTYNSDMNTVYDPAVSANNNPDVQPVTGSEPTSVERVNTGSESSNGVLAPPSVPTNDDGSVYMGHGTIQPEDKYGDLGDGLNRDVLSNNDSVKTFMFDNCQMTIGNFTVNGFIEAAEHEWHIYTAGGLFVTELAPGEKGFCHVDSDYFSAPENRVSGTADKNGQVVFYMKNTSDTTLSIGDCVVYKVYISFANHGIGDYNELPAIDYFGMTWDTAESVITDKELLGEYRLVGTPDDSDNRITRYKYGALEETAVWLDVLKSTGTFCGITITDL